MLRLLLIALPLSLAVVPADGKRFYKYQDENGIWHFTDRAPDREDAVESELIRVDQQNYVTVRRLEGNEEPTYHFTNSLAGPVSIEVRFELAENVRSEPELPTLLVLDAYESRSMLRVGSIDSGKGWRYQLSYRFSPGAPIENYDQDHLYGVPFGGDHPHLISQAFNGKFSHQEDQARHAVDISVPEGTPIVAARAGVVMQVEDDFFGRGLDMEEYASRANSVRVLHDDGTMAVYAHLKVESAVVSPGQRVSAGDKLAESGDTGFTSGAHLHFVIQLADAGTLRSIPFAFAGRDGQAIEPRRGLRLLPARP